MKNLNDFINTVCEAERRALNSPEGQELTRELLKAELKKNPGLTAEQWAKTKQDFFTFVFAMAVKENHSLMREMAGHVYNELRRAG